MAAGNNLAITSDLYLRVGGFKRTRIEELHEDHALMLAVRSVKVPAAGVIPPITDASMVEAVLIVAPWKVPPVTVLPVNVSALGREMTGV